MTSRIFFCWSFYLFDLHFELKKGVNFLKLNNLPLACQMDSLTESEREIRKRLLSKVVSSLLERKKISNGLLFQIRYTDNVWLAASEFVTLEKRCCPFLNFKLNLISDSSDFTLRIDGQPGTSDFLQEELGLG